ncbi:MAG TPA: mercuric reductase [Stellaceae bacterium]|nr:mercuric reductase [Stellaceae bacterium]
MSSDRNRIAARGIRRRVALNPISDATRDQLLASARPADWRNPDPVTPYDLLVIGAGPAGLAAVEAAIEGGAKVALIERHLLGGVSLLTGSVPSKSIIRTSRLYADMRRAEKFGAAVPSGISENFAATMERMRRLRARISAYHSAERLKIAGVDLYFGAARFTGRDAITVDGVTVRFGKALIATGARPVPTVIPGLEQAGYFTSEQAFDLRECPSRLLVIGGGPLGCELAQAFCRLGSHVVIAQNNPKFLPKEERDAAQLVSESMARDGVEIHLNTTVVAVRTGATGEKLVDLVSDDNKSTIAVDHILTGVGRIPNVERLDLETAGVACDAVPGIRVDDFLRTTNPQVYAAGDVCLEYKFTHTAEASARLAIANALFAGRKKWSALTIPWCTYTDPEVAHVGLYVGEARDRSIPIKTITVLMHDIDRAMIDGQEKGFVKIHVKEGTDEILGATIVASHAGEMINEITLAIDAGIGLSVLATVIHAYPTQASAIKMAADAFAKSLIKPPAPYDIGRPAWPTE